MVVLTNLEAKLCCKTIPHTGWRDGPPNKFFSSSTSLCQHSILCPVISWLCFNLLCNDPYKFKVTNNEETSTPTWYDVLM
jgi:hypothetical protein